ncbi:hypothetical protein Cni_G03823 [Canna indica]|uniref:Calmodulin-binding protein n=1 Tax=Canna indica TaxID=4628 RepID=A0AAQ3JSJ8_9LILI|nr:hypothetical protein Cni_G03823 [Canna indica]
MSQKRQPEDGKAGASSDGGALPEEKRQKIRFQGLVRQALQMHEIQRCILSMEPLLRKIIREEVEVALSKHLASITRQCEKQVGRSTTRSLQLKFKNKLSLPIFTGSRIEAEDSSTISVSLVDALSGQVVTTGSESTLKVEIVVLDGDFEVSENGNWTFEEFRNYIIKERQGKRPLLTGDVYVDLTEGVGVLGELSFTDNSSWIRNRKFRLGARIADGHFNGIRIREAKTDPFVVKDHRGELYKKHYPPSLDDEVWRLEKIGKDGAFHKRLSNENIKTVKDFLLLLCRDSARLRNILGGMSARMWEVTIEHARTCILGDQVHVYYPNGQEKSGYVFNAVGEVLGTFSNEQFLSVDELSNNERAEAQVLVKQAYDHWNDVVTYKKDEFFGTLSPSPPNSLFGSENIYSNFPSPVKNDGFGFTHSGIQSPEIFSLGNMRGLDAFSLGSHGTSIYDDCSSQPFFGDESFRYLPTHGYISDLPADLSNIVSKDLLEPQGIAVQVKPRRGWKTLSCVFWFLRRIAIKMKARVGET